MQQLMSGGPLHVGDGKLYIQYIYYRWTGGRRGSQQEAFTFGLSLKLIYLLKRMAIYLIALGYASSEFD